MDGLNSSRPSPCRYLHRIGSFEIRSGRHAHAPGSLSASCCCCNGSVGLNWHAACIWYVEKCRIFLRIRRSIKTNKQKSQMTLLTPKLLRLAVYLDFRNPSGQIFPRETYFAEEPILTGKQKKNGKNIFPMKTWLHKKKLLGLPLFRQ